MHFNKRYAIITFSYKVGDFVSKIKVKAILQNVTENKFFSSEVNGLFLDNKIKFIDNDIIVVLDLNNNISLYRKANDYNIFMSFILNEKTVGTYDIKGLGSLKLEVMTNKIVIKDNSIEIDYYMYIDNENGQRFNYKIEYEEM